MRKNYVIRVAVIRILQIALTTCSRLHGISHEKWRAQDDRLLSITSRLFYPHPPSLVRQCSAAFPAPAQMYNLLWTIQGSLSLLLSRDAKATVVAKCHC